MQRQPPGAVKGPPRLGLQPPLTAPTPSAPRRPIHDTVAVGVRGSNPLPPTNEGDTRRSGGPKVARDRGTPRNKRRAPAPGLSPVLVRNAGSRAALSGQFQNFHRLFGVRAASRSVEVASPGNGYVWASFAAFFGEGSSPGNLDHAAVAGAGLASSDAA
jgi:hypothetical protein